MSVLNRDIYDERLKRVEFIAGGETQTARVTTVGAPDVDRRRACATPSAGARTTISDSRAPKTGQDGHLPADAGSRPGQPVTEYVSPLGKSFVRAFEVGQSVIGKSHNDRRQGAPELQISQ